MASLGMEKQFKLLTIFIQLEMVTKHSEYLLNEAGT